ncbi:MAG: baseplate J/gp47 family protein [Candidatus Brocadiaceae bacterium]|nr:baseplate J/gp47 family protein [Candidatus Brocadiaceae bacterium]
MSDTTNCSHNRDALKLILEGTSQEQRFLPALDPAYAPVDERTVAHRMVFAQAYAAYLKYYNSNNVWEGDWQAFFNNDVSVLLAVAAVQDVDNYRSNVKGYFDFLKNRDNQLKEQELKDTLGCLFSCAATLAKQLDVLKEGLPVEIPLKVALQNLIQSQLAPVFKRLIAYYKADLLLSASNRLVAETQPGIRILGKITEIFENIYQDGLSKDWTGNAAGWGVYTSSIQEDSSVYGSASTIFERINHIATHNLFTSIFDQFLKVYARIVKEAGLVLEKTFTEWNRHEPHYALFLAFLRLFEFARAEMNTLTGRHLDFYYREILQLREKAAEPGHAHLLVELAKQVNSHEFKKGELFKAGKDDLGKDAYFANDFDFVANQAKVMELKTVYRHGEEKVGKAQSGIHQGRLYASPVANSDDGIGAELASIDKSWHPFHNKIYQDGALLEIKMPQAEIGFAIASHYLLMAEGARTITVKFTTTALPGNLELSNKDLDCLLTTEKEWFAGKVSEFNKESSNSLKLKIELSGADPAITPYLAKTHGYNFATNLPVLLVKLRHREDASYLYPQLQDVIINKIDLTVNVKALKNLAVSNDFGPVDTSKPFQPFGPSPVANSALIIGSKETFQKKLSIVATTVTWHSGPSPYNNKRVNVLIDYLVAGVWQPSNIQSQDVKSASFSLLGGGYSPYIDAPDLSEPVYYNSSSRHGFVRLKLDNDFGQNEYEQALNEYIQKIVDKTLTAGETKPLPPIGPFMVELALNYTATQSITLNNANKSHFDERHARFFHVASLGYAEQHPFLNLTNKVFLLPQFSFWRDGAVSSSEAEFYIGLTDLKPPQNLALLFQVADGTADPLSKKPDPHIHWSYLRGNEWIPFAKDEVEDKTGGLLNSGIITFAMPREASDTNTLLPAGMHWLRAAVASGSDAVCRLRLVAAQALKATFMDKDNDPTFPAKVLEAETISKLDRPNAAVKKITQPFATFDGRGKEDSKAFYTRISERLRHKDRGITLWDYERLILDAFPQIYKAKCLNHLQYEPDESGKGVYRELAPGHVTVITIPDQQVRNLRDPFRPYTSLGLLEEIGAFLGKRLSCFVTLHVRNPEFEEVRVECKVRLKDGLDETFYLSKLQESITRFLSPWAFPGGGSPSFGGKVYKSVLINFVEDLPYVDYVTDFQLFHSFNDFHGNPQTIEKNEVEGSRAVSILVSARKHVIDAINPAVAEAPGEKCPCEAT